MKTTTKLWIGLAILAALSPLGLILPEYLKAGAAWGEWGVDEIQKLVGYIPHGLEKLSVLWSAPIPDYAFKGLEEKWVSHLNLGYLASAILGIGVTAIIMLLIGRFLTRKR